MLSPLVGGLVLPQGVPAQVQAATGDHLDLQSDDNNDHNHQVGKVVKGHYLTLGASTLSSPSLNRFISISISSSSSIIILVIIITIFSSNVVLVNAGRKVRVIAQCVKFKDGKKVNN